MNTDLTDEDRKRIAEAARSAANVSVYRKLARLVDEWKAEERAKKRAALAILAGLALVLATLAAVVLLKLGF